MSIQNCQTRKYLCVTLINDFDYKSKGLERKGNIGFQIEAVGGEIAVAYNGGVKVLIKGVEDFIGLMDLALTIMDKSRDFDVVVRDIDGNLIEIPFSSAGFDFDRMLLSDYKFSILPKELQSYLIRNKETYIKALMDGLTKDFGYPFKVITSTDLKTGFAPYTMERIKERLGYYPRKIYSVLNQYKNNGCIIKPIVESPLDTIMVWSSYGGYGDNLRQVYLGKKIDGNYVLNNVKLKNLISKFFTLGCELFDVEEYEDHAGSSRHAVITIDTTISGCNDSFVGFYFPHNANNSAEHYFNSRTRELSYVFHGNAIDCRKKGYDLFVKYLFAIVEVMKSMGVPVGDVLISTTRKLKGKTYKINDVYMGFEHSKSLVFDIDNQGSPTLNVAFFLE